MSKQAAVDRAARSALEFGNAADIFRQALASAMDLNHSDLRILISLRAGESRSAGQVAQIAGLSPAAATEAVQRLVQRGLLTRERDVVDRRRMAIAVSPAASEQLARLTREVREAGRELLGRYTVDQLATIVEFLQAGAALQVDGARHVLEALRPPVSYRTDAGNA